MIKHKVTRKYAFFTTKHKVVKESAMIKPPKQSDDISQSKKEKKLASMLKKYYRVEIQKVISNDYWHPYDIYLPDYSVLIEFDGGYWHSKKNPNWKKSKDDRRALEAAKRGYKFIVIRESDWDKSHKKVISRINTIIFGGQDA